MEGLKTIAILAVIIGYFVLAFNLDKFEFFQKPLTFGWLFVIAPMVVMLFGGILNHLKRIDRDLAKHDDWFLKG
jgi:hypothetical protein